MSHFGSRIKGWINWDRITSQKWLSKIIFILIATLLGVVVFYVIHVQTEHHRDAEYFVISPSEVVSTVVTLDDSTVSVLVEQCSTFDKRVHVSFDTVWLYYADIEEMRGDPNFSPDSAPGVNGFSGGALVNPGGNGCGDEDNPGVPAAIPLGDPMLASEENPAGGMWPGFWAMDSQLEVRECLKEEPSNSETEPLREMSDTGLTGFMCVELGELIHREEWSSTIFEVLESPLSVNPGGN